MSNYSAPYAKDHHVVAGGILETYQTDAIEAFKFDYIAQLLAIAAQGLAKVTSARVVARLDSSPSTQRKCQILVVLNIAWMLFGLFTTTFQCNHKLL
ncbi:hypothetical protein V2W45_1351007 [Cenococcum geophilum]